MNAKLLIVLLIGINCYATCGAAAAAALRRTPKVYNALITTDENLTSSRAYPVIQPTIHESGVAHYPFGPYNPYGFYNPPVVRFGQPIAPGLRPRDQLPYPLSQNQFPPQLVPRPPPHGFPQQFPSGYPQPQNPPTAPTAPEQQQTKEDDIQEPAPTEQQQPVKPPTNIPPPGGYMPIDENRPQQMPNEKLPIPLNQFGLPPALIPFQQYPHRNRNPVSLPPYGYNQYPLVYDPVTGFREQYLPPYDYYPNPNTFAVKKPPTAPQKPNPITGPPSKPKPAAPTPAPTAEPPTEPTEEDQPITDLNFDDEMTTPSFESIKNGSKSKNSDVPDVPPPPIPSGAKSKQS